MAQNFGKTCIIILAKHRNIFLNNFLPPTILIETYANASHLYDASKHWHRPGRFYPIYKYIVLSRGARFHIFERLVLSDLI